MPSRYAWLKLVWAAVFLLGLTATVLHMFYIADRYLKYPTQVKVSYMVWLREGMGVVE